MSDRIICLVGPTGAGKTTVARILEIAFGANVIKSYTTRKPRVQNEYGHTFIDDVELLRFMDEEKDNIMAFTVFGEHSYLATRDMYKGKGDSIYVIDPFGVARLKECVSDAEIITVFLNLDKNERESRLIEEYKKKAENKGNASYYNEIMVRLSRDGEIFKYVKTDYCIYNHASDKTAELINNEILRKNGCNRRENW